MGLQPSLVSRIYCLCCCLGNFAVVSAVVGASTQIGGVDVTVWVVHCCFKSNFTASYKYTSPYALRPFGPFRFPSLLLPVCGPQVLAATAPGRAR